MTPKAPKKDKPEGYEWENITIKISGTEFKPIPFKHRSPRYPVSFEIVGNNPAKVGMIVTLKQPEDPRFDGKYIVTKIDGQIVFVDPHPH